MEKWARVSPATSLASGAAGGAEAAGFSTGGRGGVSQNVGGAGLNKVADFRFMAELPAMV